MQGSGGGEGGAGVWWGLVGGGRFRKPDPFFGLLVLSLGFWRFSRKIRIPGKNGVWFWAGGGMMERGAEGGGDGGGGVWWGGGAGGGGGMMESEGIYTLDCSKFNRFVRLILAAGLTLSPCFGVTPFVVAESYYAFRALATCSPQKRSKKHLGQLSNFKAGE